MFLTAPVINLQQHKYLFSNLVDPGQLGDPLHVGGVHLVLEEPGGQVLPFVSRAAVDGQARLSVLVLTLLQLVCHFLAEDGKDTK